VNECGKLVEW